MERRRGRPPLSSGLPESGKVVALDLRGKERSGARDAARALMSNQAEPDLRRLLVVDDASALVDHETAFEALLTSNRVEELLCLAVGRPRDDGQLLSVPGVISQGIGVLWVSDPNGVDWRLSSSAAALGHGEAGESEGAGLRRLVGVLSAPEVFQRVCELSGSVPGGVVSPGLRLSHTTTGQLAFLTSLASATDELLGRATAAFTSSAEPSTRIAEEIRGLPASRVAVRQGGRVAEAQRRCAGAVENASDALHRLGRLISLFGRRDPGAEALESVGYVETELADYRRLLEMLVTDTHGGEDVRAGAEDRLRDLYGLSLVAGSDASPKDSGRALGDRVNRSLRGGTTLPSLALLLRDAERELRPSGSQVYAERIARSCETDLLDRLRAPAAFPAPQRWLPVAGVVAGALASVSGSGGGYAGIALGTAVSLLWAVLLTLTVARTPGRRGTDHVGALVVNVVAALLGVAVGVGAGVVLAPPPLVAAVAFAAGIGVAIGAAGLSWASRSRRWQEALPLDEARPAVSRLTSLVDTVTAEAWSLDSARRGTVDALIRARAAVDGVTRELGDYAKKLQEDLESVPRTAMTTEHLGHPVKAWLTELACAALEPRWAELSTDRPLVHEQLAAAQTKDLLSTWERHVERHGPLDPPPFAADRHHDATGLTEDELSDISEATASDPCDVMWQLCSADQLPLLDTDRTRARAVRFAPRATRHAIAAALPPDTTWTAFGGNAGVLRLVPVRPGVVRRMWSATAEEGKETLK